MAAKAASGDGPNSWSMWRRLVDRGLNDDLLFGDTWSCGLRTVSLKEEGGARATRWPAAWGRSNNGFSSVSGAAVAEANGEESRGEAGAEIEERRRRWPMAAEMVGGNGGGHGGAKPWAWARRQPPLFEGARRGWVPLLGW
jgi:hypothetical protein